MDVETLQFLGEALRAQDLQTQKKLDKVIEQNQSIIVQTTKTNGRVTALESRADKNEVIVSNLTNGSEQTKGRDKIVWYILLAIGTIIGFAIQSFLTLKIK